MKTLKKFLTAAIVGGALVFAGCGDDEKEKSEPVPAKQESVIPTPEEVEEEVLPEIQENIDQKTEESGDGDISVDEVSCVRSSKTTQRCFAELSSVTPGEYTDQHAQVGIKITIDPTDGSYIWETDD